METELDKIPTYIDGYCKKISVSPTQEEFNYILAQHYRNKVTRQNLSFFNIIIEAKLPIMARLNLGALRFIPSTKNSYDEYYIPQVSGIQSKDTGTSVEIQHHMEHTLEALQVSVKAYEADYCNTFTSKMLMPLATYTTGIITGNLFEWLDFCQNKGAPPLIEQYQQHCLKIIKAELPNLEMYLRVVK